jgi:hypothetical protein
MAGREFGTDPYGIISRGIPGDVGPSVNFGRVGMPVQNLAAPGRSAGAGVGATLSLPVGKNIKKKAKGGSVSASKRADGCATKGKTKGKFV